MGAVEKDMLLVVYFISIGQVASVTRALLVEGRKMMISGAFAFALLDAYQIKVRNNPNASP